MKRLFAALVALVLIAALSVAALADTMTVKTDSAKVFKKKSKKSDVISRLPAGGTVDVFDSDGDWMHIHYINKKGAEKSGWIRAKDLSGGGGGSSHKHTWTDWRVTRQATCTKAGRKERTCTTCGETKEKEVEKLKHDWGKWSVTRKATCEKAGERVHKCKVCGQKEKKKIDKTEHEFGEWAVEQAASCTAEGTQSRVCKVCGKKESEEIEKLAHSFGDWTVLSALTREMDGERAHTCEVCGLEERETVKAEPAYTRKDRGEGVRGIQMMLNDLGYDAGRADGIYGPKLDKAFEAFARDRGVSFASGWLQPTQLDALTGGWIEATSQAEWRGEGGADAPVSLVLTVDDAGESGGVRTFNWTLTNAGREACTLRAVLMGLGADHDFRHDNMVAVVDAEKLKTGSANGLGGSFTVPAGLGGGGALCFRAVVESEKTGEKWLSNAVTYGADD